jgi:hypothetical protein
MSGWESLGTVLGGGTDRAGAFEEGRLRTAQTENALAQARKHQIEAIADEAQITARGKTTEMLAKHGVKDPAMLGNLMAAGYGDYADVQQGELRRQELGNRSTLSDPGADPLAQFAAGQGVQGKVLPRVDAIGLGGFTDLTTGKPNVQLTPLGDSMVAENEASIAATGALENLRNVQAGDPDYQTVSGSTHDGTVKAPSGYEPNPDFDPTMPSSVENPKLRPITGGPSDPDFAGKLGSRERQVIARIGNAALNTTADLESIMAMPSGASRGVFGTGVGGTPGSTLLDATVDSMKNRVAPEEVQLYNTVLGGLSVQLATLEKSGLAGSDALSAQYDNLQLRPEDTVETKMLKMAQMRQTVESALSIQLAQGNLPREQKAQFQQIVSRLHQAVPFGPRDVLALRQSRVPGATIRTILTAGAPVASGPTAPVGGAPSAPSGIIRPTASSRADGYPPKNERGWELMEDGDGNLAYVSPSGEIEEVQ